MAGQLGSSKGPLSAQERSIVLMLLSVLCVTDPSASWLSATFDLRQEEFSCLEGQRMLTCLQPFSDHFRQGRKQMLCEGQWAHQAEPAGIWVTWAQRNPGVSGSWTRWRRIPRQVLGQGA